MTPSLFDLPLRLGDAVTVAGLLLDLAVVSKPITDEQRSRLSARAKGLEFGALTPYWPTLERDPIHPSAYYLKVDGVDAQTLLLRVAPASTPSSGLFPKAILIGRTYVTGERGVAKEMVLNAIPWADAEATFEQIRDKRR